VSNFSCDSSDQIYGIHKPLEKFQGSISAREAHAFCVKFTPQPKPVVTFSLKIAAAWFLLGFNQP
jgi:hypothetical protein